jgi:hypothetical protein
MRNIVEERGKNQFANSQRQRDLREINRAREVISEMQTSIQEHENTGIEVVNARLNYLAEATPKPINYAYDPLCVPPGLENTSSKTSLSATAAKSAVTSRSTPAVSCSQSTKLRLRTFTIPTRSSPFTTPRSSAC